jgi:4-amino-4-deoxy-L-arabinose transferase-like glycosyltransferase
MVCFKKVMKKIRHGVANNKAEFLILTFILLAAAFLRLYRIADYMTFLGDEGRDVLVVKRMIVDHKLTLLGPTASVGGFFLGPIYYYFMAPFLWLFHLDPVGPAVMVALFGVAAVFLIWKAGRDFFGPLAGLMAAGLYTVPPLVIASSRSSWNPNLMPFFCLLIVYLLWLAVTKKKMALLGLVGFFLGITFQLHYLATFLVPIIIVYLFLFTRPLKNLKNYLLGLAGFLLGWSPFLLFELRHGFPNLKTLYRFIFYGQETGFVAGNFWPTVTDVSFRLFSRLVTNNQLVLAQSVLIVSLGVFAFFWLNSRKKKEEKTLTLLGLWLVLGIGLFGFYQKPIYDYYFGFMFPLPFLLVSFTLTKIAKINKVCLLAALSFFLLLVMVNLQGIPFRYTPNRQLDQTKRIAQIIFDKTEGQPFNFALITGQNSDHAYRYFLEIWGRSPVVIEDFEHDPERKTVTDQLMVVCELSNCNPLGHPLWEIAGFGQAEIVGHWSAPGGITVMKLVHFTGK